MKKKRIPPIAVYFNLDRIEALADFIVTRNGLEVPVSFEMPRIDLLPATREWPERLVLTTERS